MSAAELDERSVPADASVERLDKAVAKLFGVSRGRAMEWIAEGRDLVDFEVVPVVSSQATAAIVQRMGTRSDRLTSCAKTDHR